MVNLIIQTAFVGDLALSIPLMRKVKALFPAEPLWLLCRKGLGELYLHLGLVDVIVEYDKSARRSWHKVHRELSRPNFHYIFCPHQSVRSQLLAARLKAEVKVGFYHPLNFWIFNHRPVRPMNLPESLRQLSLLTAVDHTLRTDFQNFAMRSELHNPATRKDTELSLPADLSAAARLSILDRTLLARETEPLDSGKNRNAQIFLAPGSVWATKRWTEKGFIEVGVHFQKLGYQVKLTGSASERELCERISQHIPHSENLAGRLSFQQTLQEFLHGQLLVTNDSGAMHLAALVELPTVSVFGPTTLDLGYRPWQSQAFIVQQDLSCRPCGLHGAQRCPLGTHECMQSIPAQRVISAGAKLLSQNPGR